MSVPLTAKAVTGAFVVSGVIHLVKPEVFEPLVPEQLPGSQRQWVLWSGVAELACAAGMVRPRTRKAAAYASVALLAGVFPGNAKMAYDAQRDTGREQGGGAQQPLRHPRAHQGACGAEPRGQGDERFPGVVDGDRGDAWIREQYRHVPDARGGGRDRASACRGLRHAAGMTRRRSGG